MITGLEGGLGEAELDKGPKRTGFLQGLGGGTGELMGLLTKSVIGCKIRLCPQCPFMLGSERRRRAEDADEYTPCKE
jgi:hypothetical protein